MASLDLFISLPNLAGKSRHIITQSVHRDWNPSLRSTKCPGFDIFLLLTRYLWTYSSHDLSQRVQQDLEKRQLVPTILWSQWDEDWVKANRVAISKLITHAGMDKSFEELVRDETLASSVMNKDNLCLWKANNGDLSGYDFIYHDGEAQIGEEITHQILQRTPPCTRFAFPPFLRVCLERSPRALENLLSFHLRLNKHNGYNIRPTAYFLLATVRCEPNNETVRLYDTSGHVVPTPVPAKKAPIFVMDEEEEEEIDKRYLLFYRSTGMDIPLPNLGQLVSQSFNRYSFLGKQSAINRLLVSAGPMELPLPKTSKPLVETTPFPLYTPPQTLTVSQVSASPKTSALLQEPLPHLSGPAQVSNSQLPSFVGKHVPKPTDTNTQPKKVSHPFKHNPARNHRPMDEPRNPTRTSGSKARKRRSRAQMADTYRPQYGDDRDRQDTSQDQESTGGRRLEQDDTIDRSDRGGQASRKISDNGDGGPRTETRRYQT
ncbi:uncharacterized protein PgNI_02641 [Pyricularia grisea]|uniref:Uncharacterized protein n=1 Tax=Pyricularia grisea TaxID=148305 RepID=A0A6P8BB98_PYRGI|nr:uncharacterized protein PgNI_02641 [Pyricularia grisea]TLD12972.1 hypothetical protein PgNI_02641 [Pyricularia grisea]